MNIITEYEKTKLDTSSNSVLKRFASYLDIDKIQMSILKLSNIQTSFTFVYYKELLRIIRERLSAIVIRVEDEFDVDTSEMQQILTTAEDLEEAVEALEEYGDSDNKYPEEQEIREKTDEIKTTIDLILPPEIIEGLKEEVKTAATETKPETKAAVVEVAKTAEETKEAIQEQAKEAAEEVVTHAGAGAALDDLIDGIRNGGKNNYDWLLGAGVGVTAGTATAAGITVGEVLVGATGGFALPIMVGAAGVGAAAVLGEQLLEQEERDRVADAIQHAKEVVEEAIREGKSPSEAQMAGIESLQPTTPGQPDVTGLLIDQIVEGGREAVYEALGYTSLENYEQQQNSSSDSGDGSCTTDDDGSCGGDGGCDEDDDSGCDDFGCSEEGDSSCSVDGSCSGDSSCSVDGSCSGDGSCGEEGDSGCSGDGSCSVDSSCGGDGSCITDDSGCDDFGCSED